jgi:hypothetical protein
LSPEWLTAIGTIGTFVVIAASAAAALFQLRHMRWARMGKKSAAAGFLEKLGDETWRVVRPAR